MDANGLIRAIGGPLDDYFWGEYSWNIFIKKFSKKSFKIYFLKMYYLVNVCVKKMSKKCHFQSFPTSFTSPSI
jgi:hypothetical protein